MRILLSFVAVMENRKYYWKLFVSLTYTVIDFIFLYDTGNLKFLYFSTSNLTVDRNSNKEQKTIITNIRYHKKIWDVSTGTEWKKVASAEESDRKMPVR